MERIEQHPILGETPERKLVTFIYNGQEMEGYGVHAAKVARCGVPFYLSHTIIEAEGTDRVTGVVLGQVGPDWKVIPGTEKHFDVDTICLVVGLSPMSRLPNQAGCNMKDTK